MSFPTRRPSIMNVGSIPTFSRLLMILFIFPNQYKSNAERHYANLYGDGRFNSSSLENMLSTAIGGLNFLFANERFLAVAQPDTTPPSDSIYDFIVVGAGTAGATIASRLSEIENFRVLLIEAGPEESLFMDVPLAATAIQRVDEIDWQYETEPSNNYCTGMKGHRCKWPRGKVMGGSSVLNYMIATRGNPKDYDEWAQLGNQGWAYKDVLKYFKKLEDIQIPSLRNDRKYHNTDGPVTISYAPYRSPLLEAFLKAGQELGYPLVDYDGENQIGFSQTKSTTFNGYRMSSNKAYLHNRRRRNLHVSKMSMVHKILIDKKRKQTVGVQFVKYNRRVTLYARKEVILCAGAIGSPQLLMLSGIGPAKHLKKLGIDVVKDSRVGDNLMDHIAYGGLVFTIDEPVSVVMHTLMDVTKPYVKDFLLDNKGPLTISGGVEALGFVNVDDPKDHHGPPNIEFMSIMGSAYTMKAGVDNFGFNQEIREKFASLQSTYTWSMFPMLLRPNSRGWLRLKSTNANVKPRIVANYLDDPEDIRVILKGIRIALRIGETKAMKKLGAKFYNKTVAECEKYPFNSDDYWLCNTRMETLTIYHYSGTCKMGPVSDKTAVVDPTLKVIGIKGLRVADASIMPNIPRGHTNIPVHMIAEKCSDMIKAEWGYPTNEAV